ncbi:MAG: tail fiber domain-containing protein [Bacteroidota bacterium]
MGGKVGWTAWSDERFKENIKEDIPGLDFILKLKPVSYTWNIFKLNEFTGSTLSNEQSFEQRKELESIVYTGFLAQDVEKAAKQIGYNFSGVETPPNDGTPYGLRYAEFVVPLVKAVQQQQEMIELLKEQNKALWKEIESLKKK